MNNMAVLDTGFLISLVDRNRPFHQVARNYYKYFLEHGVVMLLPTVVAAEYVPQIRSRFLSEEWSRMHECHALPENWHEMPYDTFLHERRKLMAAIIRRGFESLKQV